MAKLKLLKNKVLVAGANGLLGQKLVAAFSDQFEVYGLGRSGSVSTNNHPLKYSSCDISNRTKLRALVQSINPNFVINCAAFTNVDGCEDEKEDCWKGNVTGVENLAHAARATNAVLVHISTDYVFDGVDGNYSETSKPNPLSYYGRAKLAGENAVIVSGVEFAMVRTMILYGVGHNTGHNFATWLVEKLSSGEIVRIVDDQFGHPTLVDDLALAIRRIVDSNKTGVFHVSGSECLSRYDFAVRLAETFGFDTSLIERIKTSDLKQKANRPLNSSFDLRKIRDEVGIEMSDVKTGLEIFKRQVTHR